jgi:ribonuclease HI
MPKYRKLKFRRKSCRARMSESSQPYFLVADGACIKNPGPGGYGLIVVTPSGRVTEYGGHDPATTNNRMELLGFYRGLQEIFKMAKNEMGNRKIRVISDSKYVLDGAEKYVRNWARNDWKLSTGGDVKNKELWEKILKGLDEFKNLQFQFKYELVKGHAGNDANERVDQIAVKYSHQEPIALYDGPLAQYPVSLESGEAYPLTYLSYVDGVLKRHPNWDECQKATLGKKGARYKKVTNRLQERETLTSWGISN